LSDLQNGGPMVHPGRGLRPKDTVKLQVTALSAWL